MKRALESGVSKHPFLIAASVAGLLAAGLFGASTISFAEPADAGAPVKGAPIHDGMMHGGMNRCERLMEHINHADKKLSTEQVRDIVAGHLAQFGEGTMKVGKVSAKEPGIVSVEIVTNSGSLVTTREISTKTGGPAGIEKRCEERTANARDDEHGMRDGRGHMGGFGRLAMLGAGHNRDLNLTVDQAKKLADAALIMTGNPRLKVGAVKEKDANTISVDIVTVDNALVVHREINRHTGHAERAI